MKRSLLYTALFAGVALAAGTPGSLDITISGPVGDALSVAAQADGKLVAVGIEHGTESTFKIVRYNADGSRDNAFGTVTPFASAAGTEAQHVSIDGSGRILAAGAAIVERTSGRGKKQQVERVQMLALVRLLSNGNADTTFGNGGEVLVEVQETDGVLVRGLAIQANGKIVVVGRARVKSEKVKGKGASQQPDTNSALLLARFHSDGALDTSFGTDGLVVDNVSKDDDIAGLNGIGLQSDGKIVLAAMLRDITGSDGYGDDAAYLRRYDSDGSLDTSFGSGGTTVIGSDIEMPSIAIDSSDRILLAAGDIGGDGFVVRYDAGGALDTSFARYETNLAASSRLRGVAILSDGRIVAAGETGGDGFTIRLNANGSLDTTYGISAVVDSDFIFDLAVDADGDYVIAGGKSGAFLLARYCR